MSAVRGVSLLRLEGLAPGVILGWTARLLLGIFGLAGGRIGLRRSATRASVGRLYASGPGLLAGARAFGFCPAGVGRRSVKLRGSGGRPPGAGSLADLAVLQVLSPETDLHAPIKTLLDHHLSPSL